MFWHSAKCTFNAKIDASEITFSPFRNPLHVDYYPAKKKKETKEDDRK